MKAFAYKFEPVLKLRRNQRDLCRQLLADALRRDDELLLARGRVVADRHVQLDEIREKGRGGDVDIDGSASRRFYAGQLIGDIGRIERQRALAAQQIALCRQHLLKADQAVKVLEKLEEKQRSDFQFEQERRAARELDECGRPRGAGE